MIDAGIAIKVAGITKSYGGRRVLRGLDLEVQAGEFVAVVGRSGCGKSTLLRLLAGIEKPDGGVLSFDREDCSKSQAEVRMIFQEARLLPWSSVLANVSLGARPAMKARRLGPERDVRARALLGNVGLADRAAEWPGQLSGGQRQRVALARGLMSEPRLLLLDEPLGALDALTRLEMQHLVGRLWRAAGFTAVLVTHDIHEAVALADRVVVLEEGAIVADVEVGMARPRAQDDRRFVETASRLLRHILGNVASSIPPSELDAPDEPPEPIDAQASSRGRDRNDVAEGFQS